MPTQNRRSEATSRELVFVSWPLRQGGILSWSVMGLPLLAGFLVGWFQGGSISGILAGLLVLVAMWRHWLPVSFHISSGGLEQSAFGRRSKARWSAVNEFIATRRGVWILFGYGSRDLWSWMHGWFIRCDSNNQRALFEAIERFRPQTIDV